MFVIAKFVDQRDKAQLRFVESQEAGEKERAKFEDGRAQSHPTLPLGKE